MIGFQRKRSILYTVAACALLLLTTGCGSLFGRPQTYSDLADSVVEAFSHDRYDLLRELVVTNEEIRAMAVQPEGDERGHYAPAENAILESWDKVRNAGSEAGVLWRDASLSSAIALNAHNKFKEKVDVKVIIEDHGNKYEMVIRNAQRAHEGMVLTDKVEWIGPK